MAANEFAGGWRRYLPERDDLVFWGLVLNTELLLVVVYLLVTNVTLTEPRYTVYGLVWVTLSIWAFRHVDAPDASDRTRRRALGIAVGYFLVLGAVGGLFTFSSFFTALGVGHTHSAPLDTFSVSWLPPGWGPTLLYHGQFVEVILMPARVLGYLALAYLVYVTVLDVATAAAVPGIVGLFSCVSCAWPVLASVLTGVFGASAPVVTTVTVLSLDISTAVFVLTVGLLAWRPLTRSD